MNTSVRSHLALTILPIIVALTVAPVVSAQTVPQHQIPARKMLYPQREWGDWQNYPVRTVQDISPAPKEVPLDRFGGRADRHTTRTGFDYTRKIDGRWWFIDPDGHPYLNAAVVSVTPASSTAPAAALAKTFGTQAAWMSKTRELLLSNGFNGVGAWSDVSLLRGSPEQSSRPLAYAINLDIMSAYGVKHGGTHDAPGQKAYPENTIFAFDPAFEAFADQYVAAKIAEYRDDPNLLGYFSDNELPLTRANLDGFLRLPANDPGRQAAEQWMRDHRATTPTDDLRIDFLEYEADHYFRVVYSAIRKADPNHLYLGCRFAGQSLKDPELFRAIGKYAGAISINIYGIWQPDAETTAMWERESGKPFMVTEFYAKGEDSGMPNHTGAGWLVHTQDDRGLFYENFVLALLQSRSCVGWHWFKYQDNDPDDPHAEASNKDSNKGIVDRFYKPYDALFSRMRDLNLKMYGVADVFDAAVRSGGGSELKTVHPTITTSAAQNGAVVVTLASTAPNSTIYYSVDGSTPTASSQIYEAPFLVASNLTVNAAAMASVTTMSDVASQSFTANIPSGTLVWSEEFTNTTSASAPLNSAVWTYDQGNKWSGELETYCPFGSNKSPCDSANPNVFVGTDGYLHLVARQPSPGIYTSGRVKTQGLFSLQYGRLEARVKLPEGKGYWPAVWTMGNNVATVGWPANGEQDVMERVNGPVSPDWVKGSIHGPGFTGVPLGTVYHFPVGGTASGWHTYGMIWSKGSVAYYVDDHTHPYATFTPSSISGFAGAVWPFDAGQSNYIILNLAVGGGWPGPPDSTTTFPSEMLVDYVRIYTN